MILVFPPAHWPDHDWWLERAAVKRKKYVYHSHEQLVSCQLKERKQRSKKLPPGYLDQILCAVFLHQSYFCLWVEQEHSCSFIDGLFTCWLFCTQNYCFNGAYLPNNFWTMSKVYKAKQHWDFGPWKYILCLFVGFILKKWRLYGCLIVQ